MKKLVLLFALLSAATLVQGQTAVYAEYGASDFHLPNIGWQYGPTFGVYYAHWGVPFVRVGFDARASFIGSGSTHDDSGFIGPRIALHPHVIPLMPWAEALVGASSYQFGQGSAKTSGTSLSYNLAAGLDLTILPRLDWRVIDYSWQDVTGVGQQFRPETYSTGLVLRLP